MAERVFIFDCDPGWDDALALILALASDHLPIIAITTVFGNGPVEETTLNARRIATVCRRPDLVVYAGCHRALSGTARQSPSYPAASATIAALPAQGKTGDRHATDFMIQAAQRYGPELTIVATAPLSNVATALMRDPDAMAGVGQLVVMGGALGRGNITEHAEFNLRSDPEAAKITLTSAIPKVVIPLETCALLPADKDFVSQLQQIHGDLSSIVAAIAAERLALKNGETVPLYDVLATLIILNAEIFGLQSGTVDVEAEDELRLGQLSFVPGELHPNAKLAISLDSQAAYSLIYNVLKAA